MHTKVVRIPKGKKPHGTPSRKWGHYIKLHLTGRVREDVDWIYLALDRVR